MFKNPWLNNNLTNELLNTDVLKTSIFDNNNSVLGISEIPDNNVNEIIKPSWVHLYKNYPGLSVKTIDLYNSIGGNFPKFKDENELNSSYLANSCAFRMSRGLNLSGAILPNKKSKEQLVLKGADKYYYWGRVRELYPILQSIFKAPLLDTRLKKAKLGESKIKMSQEEMNKYYSAKGVIMFEVSGWGDASGHFTLWDGSNLIYPGDLEHDNPNSDKYYFHMKYENNNRVIQTDRIILWELK